MRYKWAWPFLEIFFGKECQDGDRKEWKYSYQNTDEPKRFSMGAKSESITKGEVRTTILRSA